MRKPWKCLKVELRLIFGQKVITIRFDLKSAVRKRSKRR